MNNYQGWLNLYKPANITSFGVVKKIKKKFKINKIGHAGTLDPQATGVLPICFGQATRVMEYLVDSPKTYRASVHLGVSTDTYDSQGMVTDIRSISSVREKDIVRELESFRGVFEQVPPMYSALKQDGQRLYNLARAGKDVVRPPREVQVYSLQIRQWKPPELELDIDCGRGMYVRSLAHDLGVALGCGAHLSKLARLHSGPFDISKSVTIEEVEEATLQRNWQSMVFPVDYPLLNLKAAIVQKPKNDAVRRGRDIYIGLHPEAGAKGDMYRLYSEEGHFVALIRPASVRGLWRAQKVFSLR